MQRRGQKHGGLAGSRAVDPKTNMCVTVCVVVSVWLFLGSMFVVHSRVV